MQSLEMRSWRMLPGWDEVFQQSSSHKHHCISAYLMPLQWVCGVLQTTLLSSHLQTIWAKPQLWGWITWRNCKTISENISSVFHTNPSQPGVCCCRTTFPGMVYEASGPTTNIAHSAEFSRVTLFMWVCRHQELCCSDWNGCCMAYKRTLKTDL